MSNTQPKLAVLIDADNTPSSAITEIMAEIAKYGVASAKRIYGDWSSSHLKGWQDNLLKHALIPVQQFAYTKGKDATDMQLIIDAMDLLYSDTFDGFCLLSSDSDFTPLAMRVRESGLTVYGFGRKTTPEAFRQACDRFFYIENLQEKVTEELKEGEREQPTTSEKSNKTRPTTQQIIESSLKSLLYKAIKECINDNTGWAYMGDISNYLTQTQSDFDPRSYGYAKLSNMLKKLDSLQFHYDEANRMYCRKIPYGELIQLLNKATQKFQSKKGWSKVSTVENYITPRWDYKEYGFDNFEKLLETVHNIEIEKDSLRIKAS
ncbi:NYN domain-containing protein [Phocoenobacter skyensis]|uniref:NYN domain-containing protein n=1 Tax=Phocoenobacter skyensis TaxID=97481 RepID=A0A1H7XPQ4_9PAST|nr:NYN domain-containing protein [Pasteurella skyensis]MDP8080095.1 NYN domain-containing protein [Pasteurella skyensis]MDP8086057.1 NYN domain-containing protein [Pasteurella skyensis]MDP8169690.1 NYN domain-containing protein [Pasteurella skyensis]MDP8175142.1 NYN domain-containing protein [Pasteurella skyensis]MDP8185779.1 NYN domain-containing protein [Pasteurella skyensis]